MKFLKLYNSKKFPEYPYLKLKVPLRECTIRFFDKNGDECENCVSNKLFEFYHPKIKHEQIVSISINEKDNLVYVHIILTKDDLVFSDYVNEDKEVNIENKLLYY